MRKNKIKNESGITIIALMVTIVVILILVSVSTYSGINMIKEANYTTFINELKVMQMKVNELYDRNKNEEQINIDGILINVLDIGNELPIDSGIIFNKLGINDTGYKYYDYSVLKNLGIEGTKQTFLVNVEKRSVVSYMGIEYDGETHYILEQSQRGLYNVEYQNTNTGAPTFDLSYRYLENNRWTINISNIEYTEGNIDKWDVNYRLLGKENWVVSKDLSFIIQEKGKYEIRIINNEISSEIKNIELLPIYNVVDIQGKVVNNTQNIKVTDEYGNIVIVPAEFMITYDADKVTEGIVIEDREGNQFVWVPVGEVSDGTNTHTINLSRYTFATNGTKTDLGDGIITSNSNNYQELETSTYGNTVAKDLQGFVESTKLNGGYYIGRYEASDSEAVVGRTTSSSMMNKVASKKDKFVYNYITQPQAAELSRNMYSNSNFESDLVNSYAWDTAIVFIQTFGQGNYSRRTSLSSSLSKTGVVMDEQLNINDMAGNVVEWTTETRYHSGYPTTYSGGTYQYYNEFYTSHRNYNSLTNMVIFIGFRPIIYITL